MSTPVTHKIATDALATLGTVIDASAGRDAIHLAVEPVEAGEKLFPGQHIRIDGGIAMSGGKTVGIVDPFLPGPVFQGQKFWLVVYPRTITSLRHVWEHPAFPSAEDQLKTRNDSDVAAAERWLRNYADEIDEGFNTLLEAADQWLESGEYFYGTESNGYHGKFEGESLHPDFWSYYQMYRGKVVPVDQQGSFFTCAC
jgi:hypothetical protein